MSGRGVWLSLVLGFLLFNLSQANKKASGSGSIFNPSRSAFPQVHGNCKEDGLSWLDAGSYARTSSPDPWRVATSVALAPKMLAPFSSLRIFSQIRPSRVCEMQVPIFLPELLRMELYVEDGGSASSLPHKLEERLLVLEVAVPLCKVETELECACSRGRGDRWGKVATPLSLLGTDALPELAYVKVCVSGATLTHGDPKLQPNLAVAIHGEGSRSVLWSVLQRYFFLLYWRIFDLGEGRSGAVIPSGMFPGDDGGALASRSMAVGNEDTGPDCVPCVSLEVLFVILEVATVIFLFFEVLLVSLYKPHE